MIHNLIGVVRVSTEEQASEGRAGIDRQKADIDAIRARGANILRIEEVIESGTRTLRHEKFQQIFRDLTDPNIHGVAVSNLDRLVRPDRWEDFQIFDYFKDNRKLIYTPGGVVDPATQSGFLESTVRTMFSGLELQLIKQRTNDGKERDRKKGKNPNPNRIPRGVLWDRERGWRYDLDPNDVAAERYWPQRRPGDALLVKQAFELLVHERLSYRAIADLTGLPVAFIERQMLNPIWIGIRHYNHRAVGPVIVTDKGKKYRKVGPRDTPLDVPVMEEGLIPLGTWEQAKRIIGERKHEFGFRKARRGDEYLLRGILKCPHGHSISPQTTGRNSYYQHRRRGGCDSWTLRREAVDAAVTALICEYWTNREFLKAILHAHLDQIQPPAKPSPERALRSADIDKQRERLLDAYQSGDIAKDQLRKRTKALDEQAKTINILYPLPKPQPLDLAGLAGGLITLFAEFAYLPMGEKRELLRSSFKGIRITGGLLSAVTVRGELLSTGGKLSTWCYPSLQFATCADFTLQLPQPITIADFTGRAA